MNTYRLKVNYAHLKEEVEYNYFTVKDQLYRAYLFLLYSSLYKERVEFVSMDDSYYNNILQELLRENHNPNYVLNLLEVPKLPYLIIDLSLYLDDFLHKYLSNSTMNILGLELHDIGYIEFWIKQLKRRKR